MRFGVRLAIAFYMIMMLFVGSFMALLAFNIISLGMLQDTVHLIYTDLSRRWILGTSAILILLLNYSFGRIITGDHKRGKTIAFYNPAGLVTVSLTAMEDLVRRVISRDPAIKDVRASVTAREKRKKKRIEAVAQVALSTEVNIPELTATLQEIVKGKIQDTIGAEETVIVRVDVVKIASDRGKDKGPKNKGESLPEEATVPFFGYRA
jgi:hypothetical protein